MDTEKQIQKKPKLTICVPAYGAIPPAFFQNFMSVIHHCMKKYNTQFITKEIQPVDKARNELIKLAMQRDPDYILFIDTDNLIAPEGVDYLINTMKEKSADLVSALYFVKGKPYYPVLREYRNGLFWKIEDVNIGEIIKIDGCGMGSCLIKADVFKKTSYPWFKFNYEMNGEEESQLAEDLYFCRQMINKGLKMYCDTRVISSHIGSAVDVVEYMGFQDIIQSIVKERTEIQKDISDFSGMTYGDVEIKVMDGPLFMKREWEEKDPKTAEEIKEFYKETKNYLFDLAHWHFSNRRQFDLELTADIIENVGAKTVLDFGCGIGQNAILLARQGVKVTLADLDSYTLNFAIERFKKHKLSCDIWTVDKDKHPTKKYDVILAFDVFEHMTIEDMEVAIEQLISMKHKDTKVYQTSTFTKDAGGNNPYPMHFNDEIEKRTQLIEKLIKEYDHD